MPSQRSGGDEPEAAPLGRRAPRRGIPNPPRIAVSVSGWAGKGDGGALRSRGQRRQPLPGSALVFFRARRARACARSRPAGRWGEGAPRRPHMQTTANVLRCAPIPCQPAWQRTMRIDAPKSGESTMTTAALDPPELSRHWVKRLARRMGVPTETARCWIYRRMPASRRGEIAQALLAECDRLEALIQDTRAKWAGVANEAAGAMAGGEADRARQAARRMGRPVTRP